MDVRLPNGTVVKSVPENITQSELQRRVIAAGLATEADFGAPAQPQAAPEQPPVDTIKPRESTLGRFLQGFGYEMSSTPTELADVVADISAGGSDPTTSAAVAEMRARQKPVYEGSPAAQIGGFAADVTKTLLPFGGVARGLQAAGKAIPAISSLATRATPLVQGLLYGASQGTAEDESRAANALLSGAAGVGGQALGGYLQRVGGEGLSKVSQQMRDLGLSITPAQRRMLGPVSNIYEGILGEAPLASQMSKANQPRINEIAKKYLGQSDASNLEQAVNSAKRSAAQVYERIGKELDSVKIDDEAFASVGLIKSQYDEAIAAFPSERSARIAKEIQDFYQPGKEIKGELAKNKVRSLRRSAAGIRKKAEGDAKLIRQAEVEEGLADILEGAIERRLSEKGQSGLFKEFKNARQLFGKTYDIEEAVDASGNLDLTKLAARFKSPGKRSQIAGTDIEKLLNVREQFPQLVKASPERGLDVNVVDALLAGGGITGLFLSPNPYSVAIASRPFQRNILTRPSVQTLGDVMQSGIRPAQQFTGSLLMSGRPIIPAERLESLLTE